MRSRQVGTASPKSSTFSKVYRLQPDSQGEGERKVTTVKGTQVPYAAPTWSPDGKDIVVTAASISAADALVAVRVADGSQRILARLGVPLGQAAWLANQSGLLVAVADYSKGSRGQIWFVSYPQGQVQKLTNDLSDYSLYVLSLSGDSSQLASVQSDIVNQIWVGRGPNAELRPLPSYQAVVDIDWLLNGTLVYSTRGGEIAAMAADGSNQKVLTAPDDHTNSLLSACGDGRHIAFVSTRKGQPNLWRMEADGNNATLLTDLPDYNSMPITCSSDGKSVAYTADHNGEIGLWTVPIEGGKPRLVTNFAGWSPTFSLDGRQVASYTMPTSEDVPSKLVLVPFAGGQPTTIADSPVDWPVLRWVPNRKAVQYISTDKGVGNIWEQPLYQGAAPRRITNSSSGEIFSFAWSRDGKNFAMVRGQTRADVVLMSNFK